MITLIAEHWGDAGSIDRGMEAFKKNSENLKATKGLVSRMVLKSDVDPYKITTVTTFASREDYEAFVNSVNERNAERAREGRPPLFKGEKLEGYEVLASI